MGHKLSPEFMEQWESLIEGVDKESIPLSFIKKLVVKLTNRRQRSVNVKKLLAAGLGPEEIERILTRKMEEFDDDIIGVEFLLDVQTIADRVQPETNKLLGKL